MIVGSPREIKVREYRVGMTPPSVRELSARGHHILIERDAGAGIGATDADYQAAGAEIVDSAAELFRRVDIVVKVKEPSAEERRMLRADQVLFTYLHLAPDPHQTAELVASKSVCIAYETVTSPLGTLPLLAPMSEVAGRMAVQIGARFLEKTLNGPGILLGGVPGVLPAKVVVLGGGVVGTHATHVALGMGADTFVLDSDPRALRRLWNQFGPSLKTVYSTRDALNTHLKDADVVIGGVLLPGAAAPKLITRDHVRVMKVGSIIVDVAIDQGGCAETSRVTTHDEPTYVVDDVVHYCVANMPGGVPKTSTYALNNATLSYILALADKGWHNALREDPHLRNGLNVWNGKITCKPVADALGYPYTSPEEALRR